MDEKDEARHNLLRIREQVSKMLSFTRRQHIPWVPTGSGLCLAGSKNESPCSHRESQEPWDMGRMFPMVILVPSSVLREASYIPVLGFHEINPQVSSLKICIINSTN